MAYSPELTDISVEHERRLERNIEILGHLGVRTEIQQMAYDKLPDELFLLRVIRDGIDRDTTRHYRAA